MYKNASRSSTSGPDGTSTRAVDCRHRLVGVILVALGAASAVIGLTPAMAAGSDVTEGEATEVASATLEWAFSEYVATSTGLRQDRGATAPASDGGQSWTFPAVSSGTYVPATGTTVLRFDGGLHFGTTLFGNYGFRLTNLIVEVDGDGSGRLVADVATRGPGASTWDAPAPAITVVEFSVTDDEVTDDGTDVIWTVAPDYPLQADSATFTEPAFDGARQFPDSYLSVIDAGFHAHFSDSTSSGQPNANNPNKPPAPLTVAFTYATGSSTTTTSSSTPSTTSTSTPTTTAPSTTSTSTTTTTSTTSTTTPTDRDPEPHGSVTATGPRGQTLTVTPVYDLDPSGATVSVQGSEYDPDAGVYLAFCVDKGATAAPSPCVGGADQSGESESSRWITNHPPAPGISMAFGPDGDFSTTLIVMADDGTVDCFDEDVRCVVATRADHTRANDRSADVKVPVYFTGQTPPSTNGDGDPGDGGGNDTDREGDDPAVAREDLPRTGSDTMSLVVLGAAMVIVGTGFLKAGRRRGALRRAVRIAGQRPGA